MNISWMPEQAINTFHISMIQKVKEEYKVLSENGRNMGTYKTEAAAKKRLYQMEYFKRKNS